MAGAHMPGRWVSAGYKKDWREALPAKHWALLVRVGWAGASWLCWLGVCIHSDGKHSSQTDMQSAGTVSISAACI